MRGHSYDALVGVAGCDKSLPGMMMAMLRLNVPICLHLWRIDPSRPLAWQGRYRRRRLRGRRHAFRRKNVVGDLDDLERRACPGDGACGGQFTANTMAGVSEAIGLALPLSSALPAP